MDIELKEFSGATPYNNLDPDEKVSCPRNKYRVNEAKGSNWRCVVIAAVVVIVLLILGMGGFVIYNNMHHNQQNKNELLKQNQNFEKQELKQELLKQNQKQELLQQNQEQELHKLKQNQEIHKLKQDMLKQDLAHWMETMKNSIEQINMVSVQFFLFFCFF